MADQWLTLARDAYSESTSFFDAGIRREIEQDLRQFQGLHPPGSKYMADAYRSRARFFRPKTRGAIRKNEAVAASAFFSNADVISLEPEDDQDKLQVASAAVWQEVMNYRLGRTMPWFTTLIGAYQDAQTVGVCISYQHWIYDQKRGIDKPACKLLAVENVRFSPFADWQNPVSGSPYFIELIPMLVKDVRARMTQVDEKTGQPKWFPLDDRAITAAALRYGDSIRLQRNSGRADQSGQESSITSYSLVWVHRNLIEWNGRDYIYYTLGDEHMLSTPVEVEQVYAHGERPYVVGTCIIETHKLYPSGVARISRDIQGELNQNANQRLDNVSFAMNKRYFAKRGKQIDLRSLTRNVPGSVTMLEDPDTDVKVVDTPDVTASAYSEQDRLNLDFDDLVGTFSQASVGANRNLAETVGGMELLTTDASMVTAYQLKTFAETWVKPVLVQLLGLEQHYETDQNLFMLAGKKAQSAQRGEPVVIDGALMMQQLSVRVNVGVGATTPQTKLNNFLFALKSLREMLVDDVLTNMGADVQEIANEIFSKLGYDGPGRFFQWGQQDPRVSQLEQRISELEDELRKKEDPALTAAKVKKTLAEADKIAAGKVKEGVEAVFGAMQAAEVVAAVPMVTPVADQIMRAAGYIPSTPPGIDPGFAPGVQGPIESGSPLISAAASVPPVDDDVGEEEEIDRELPGSVDPSTNPMTPTPSAAPKSPFVGPNSGIETMRSDTKGASQ